MKKKDPNRFFFRILIILIIAFGAISIAMKSGYYDSKLRKNIELTEEAINKFENDVKEGKEIDAKEYLSDEYSDYSNKMSKLGMSLSNSTEKFMTRGIGDLFKFISKLFS